MRDAADDHGPGLVEDTGRELAALARRLEDAAAGTLRLAEHVARDWPDDRGREWTERVGLVHRQLVREVSACLDLADRLTRGEDDSAEDAELPRLGDTAARRADDRRGVRIAVLPWSTGWDGEPGPR